MPDLSSVFIKLEDIIRCMGAGNSAEAITTIDSVLREDIDPLCAQPDPRRDFSKRAVKLRDELMAVRSAIVRNNAGEALSVAYGALANWTRGGQR